MYIKANEFEVAFLAVEKEYPKISRQLAESFISKLGDLVTQNRQRSGKQKFVELLRQALNDSHVWNREDREPYKVLAGKFFGRRGGLAARTGPRPKKMPKIKQSPSLQPVPTFERVNGQLAWKI